MLTNLHIKNLALIDELDISLGSGLNILSGETGAGKSIIIDSISLGLGGKVDKNMLRSNTDHSLVELEFDMDEEIIKILSSMDIPFEDSTLVVTRKITGNKNQVRINGETFNVSFLKSISPLLIDIYGQNEHYSLLSNEKQLEIIDSFGENKILPVKNDLSEKFRAFSGLRAEYEKMSVGSDELIRQKDLLEYEINELENASLRPGEDEEAENRYRILANSQKIIENIYAAGSLCGYDNGAGAMIGKALKDLSQVADLDTVLSDIYSSLNEIDALLGDINREISSYCDDFAFDEAEFDELNRRIDEINRLKKKYGFSIDAILESLDEKREQLDRLNNHDLLKEKCRNEMEMCKKEVERLTGQLSVLRVEAAEDFTASASKEFEGLNFNQIRFAIKLDKKDNLSSNGCDRAEFMLSTNPGEEPRPLKNIASGGELSRIMLGIKSLFASKEEARTIIFDEIDTGISGVTAQKVAEKICDIAKKRQIICITHLPQIASAADTHFLIEKISDSSSTKTNIRKLDHEESVKEIARMIGGAKITDQTLAAAREMKK